MQLVPSNVHLLTPLCLELIEEILFSFVWLCMPLLTLVQVTDRTKMEPTELKQLVKKLLIIIGRVARLLEIKDFDPEDFSSTLSDGLDKQQLLGLMSSSHMPYILNRLNVSLELEVEEGVCVCARACVRVYMCECVLFKTCVHVCGAYLCTMVCVYAHVLLGWCVTDAGDVFTVYLYMSTTMCTLITAMYCNYRCPLFVPSTETCLRYTLITSVDNCTTHMSTLQSN